ncbi:hypothetical protein L3X38_020233 [Prunus dulcis]|uniref:KH domain-containing protein n=1 Tax=Prunus dulcis TaxID=3755 RepID=A0AAD4ZCR3_PRUDU|nr:hypothetical protein L3X38_020233 [Prunus dulcis]
MQVFHTNIRQIRILKDDHLPACALNSDELVQISGEAPLVKKALFQIASRLHDNPSRSQHLLTSAVPMYTSGGSLMGPSGGPPIVGIAPLMGPYGAKEFFEDPYSATVEAAESLPKIASEDDEMVQISGDLDIAKDALIQVVTRLRANLFDREGAGSAFLPVLPYLPVSTDGSDGPNYDSRDGKRHGRGRHSYSAGYGGSSDFATNDSYGSYGGSQIGGSGSAYGAYGAYSSGRSGSSGLSSQNPVSRRRNYGY